MQPHSTGSVYVNYLGREADEGADRVKAAYGVEKYPRLLALKNQCDPTNLFRLNQNIRPADRVETLFPTALAIAIGNELLSEVEAAIRFVKTCSMLWRWTGRVEARRRRLFRP